VSDAPGRCRAAARPRDLGVVVGTLPPGRANAISDVPGVGVGHVTLISGEGPLVPGRGPVRTGVTVVVPHPGNIYRLRPAAAVHVINGFGKAVGLAQVTELGELETPIVLTNTLNVFTAADALVGCMIDENPNIGVAAPTVNPVVAECNDGYLNDIQGRHVQALHVRRALELARGAAAHRGSPVEEGSVGAGTGMCCLGHKGGIGSASRCVAGPGPAGEPGFVLGALTLCNYGRRRDLRVLGLPIGLEMFPAGGGEPGGGPDTPAGSVIVVLATNAPLTPRQLGRLARRCGSGLARTGSLPDHGSGDFVLAFSTGYLSPAGGGDGAEALERRPCLRDDSDTFGRLLRAAADTTEEAVYGALFAAGDMTGRDGHHVDALSVAEVLDRLRRHGFLRPGAGS